MAASCLFCKIILGEIFCEKIFENNKVMAFKDIMPRAREHYIFIHKKHTHDLLDMFQLEPEQVSDIFRGISEYLQTNKEMIFFRIVNNSGQSAGQTVFHTHFHLLSGEKLGSFNGTPL